MNAYWQKVYDTNKQQWGNDIKKINEGTYDWGFDSGVSGMDAASAFMTGATNIASSSIKASEINDTSEYDNRIANLNQIGYTDYGNFDELSQAYINLNSIPLGANYDRIRGMSGLQAAGTLVGNTITGATTGFSMGGGPYGAAAGAAVGFGAGLIGLISGDTKASAEKNRIESEDVIAYNRAKVGLQTRHDNILNQNFHNGVGAALAKGGQIERKQMSIQEFADKIMSQPRDYRPRSSGFTRVHCNGGTMIRFKG